MSPSIKPGKARGSPEGFLALPEAKGSGIREHTRGCPVVGREGRPRRKKMAKAMEEWLEWEKAVEAKVEGHKKGARQSRSEVQKKREKEGKMKEN